MFYSVAVEHIASNLVSSNVYYNVNVSIVFILFYLIRYKQHYQKNLMYKK